MGTMARHGTELDVGRPVFYSWAPDARRLVACISTVRLTLYTIGTPAAGGVPFKRQDLIQFGPSLHPMVTLVPTWYTVPSSSSSSSSLSSDLIATLWQIDPLTKAVVIYSTATHRVERTLAVLHEADVFFSFSPDKCVWSRTRLGWGLQRMFG